jgi:predicted  nucleic acid-binding Zn-ribbon protein
VLVSALSCPQCGGVLPKAARWMLVTCPHCGSKVSANKYIVRRAAYATALSHLRDETRLAAALTPEPCVQVGERVVKLYATLARTDHADVYVGQRLGRFAERLTVKVAHDEASERTHDTAIAALTALQKSKVDTAPFHTTRLPQVVAHGIDRLHHDGKARGVLLLRHPPDYWGNLNRVLAHHPLGIDARHVAWIAARAYDLIDFVHASGWVHGALSLDHLLIQPRDHSLMFVGWSQAQTIDKYHAYLRQRDLLQLSWSLRRLLSAQTTVDAVAPPNFRADVPAALANFFTAATYEDNHSWITHQSGRSLFEELAKVVTESFGPRRFVHFNPRAAAPGSAKSA